MIENVVAGIFLMIAFFILGGNSLTIAAIYKNPKLNTASNQFILGLAIADLLVYIITVPNIC
jgi:7 transmembrane receptor (rhodopsin family)